MPDDGRGKQTSDLHRYRTKGDRYDRSNITGEIMTAPTTQGIATKGFATYGPEAKFEEFEFARREIGPKDILIDIQYCGICHSDIHQARAEWEPLIPSIYPMVPGHEIVGRVSQVGGEVSKFKTGDIAGIGCFVDSCGECPACTAGVEQ